VSIVSRATGAVSIFPDLIVGKSKIHGQGAYAGKHFNSGDFVLEFTGGLCMASELPEPYSSDRWMQVGADVFMGGNKMDSVDDLANHSCDPSTAVIIGGGKAILKAIRPVRAMMEITFDYSLTMRDDPWTMKCNCGARSCRGEVREYKLLPAAVRERYEWMKIVPDYVLGLK
jgi:SET domain-containing protein